MHLEEVLDDPHALVIANPPTYFSGYEKFYDTQGKMTWKEPEYQLFDPETGHQQFYDLCMGAKALVLCYQEKKVGEAVGYTIFGRPGTRADLNAYITTNREEEATALANGKKIKRPSESKLEPLDCSMLPRDYEIKEDSKVQIIPIKTAQAQYYRVLWTHNFVGSSATYNRVCQRLLFCPSLDKISLVCQLVAVLFILGSVYQFHNAPYLFVFRVPGKHCGTHLCDLFLLDIIQKRVHKRSILRQHIAQPP